MADAGPRIGAALAAVEVEHGARILFAVESGSRAWGHPSPDSDYDVRFVYHRPLASYLTVGRRRDVLEPGLIGDLDLAGWDIDKALRLLVSGNPSILEWLASPIRYHETPWRARIEALADMGPHRRAAYWHYRALARRQRELLGGDGPVKLKRYFYVIRPALAVAWLGQHPSGPDRVPMALPDLLAQTEIATDLRQAIAELLAAKAETSEMGTGPRIACIDTFVAAHLDGDGEAPSRGPPAGMLRAVDDLFREIVTTGF